MGNPALIIKGDGEEFHVFSWESRLECWNYVRTFRKKFWARVFCAVVLHSC
jgi:hypothetical protein